MSFKTEAEHHIHTIADRPGLTTDQENVQSMEKKNTQLVPLTVGLCLAVFLLSVDRTIDAVVRNPPPLSGPLHNPPKLTPAGWTTHIQSIPLFQRHWLVWFGLLHRPLLCAACIWQGVLGPQYEMELRCRLCSL